MNKPFWVSVEPSDPDGWRISMRWLAAACSVRGAARPNNRMKRTRYPHKLSQEGDPWQSKFTRNFQAEIILKGDKHVNFGSGGLRNALRLDTGGC
jgi:hypothetical protein